MKLPKIFINRVASYIRIDNAASHSINEYYSLIEWLATFGVDMQLSTQQRITSSVTLTSYTGTVLLSKLFKNRLFDIDIILCTVP